jgi:hypothetical protein
MTSTLEFKGSIKSSSGGVPDMGVAPGGGLVFIYHVNAAKYKPRVSVDLTVPEGVQLQLTINGIQLMPETERS